MQCEACAVQLRWGWLFLIGVASMRQQVSLLIVRAADET